jgi:hypothetical protein
MAGRRVPIVATSISGEIDQDCGGPVHGFANSTESVVGADSTRGGYSADACAPSVDAGHVLIRT